MLSLPSTNRRHLLDGARYALSDSGDHLVDGAASAHNGRHYTQNTFPGSQTPDPVDEFLLLLKK
jgi:hypothetical protein